MGSERRCTSRLVAGCACACLIAAGGGVSFGASRPVAYCPLPNGGGQSWAFRTGVPIQGATGSYGHGHGSVSGSSASGHMCQVDRVRSSLVDRQVILAITHGRANLQRGITVAGVYGARLELPVRISSSTDGRCNVGTHGTVTMISSYNGVHEDSVRFVFSRGCHGHDHYYKGPSVHVALSS